MASQPRHGSPSRCGFLAFASSGAVKTMRDSNTCLNTDRTLVQKKSSSFCECKILRERESFSGGRRFPTRQLFSYRKRQQGSSFSYWQQGNKAARVGPNVGAEIVGVVDRGKLLIFITYVQQGSCLVLHIKQGNKAATRQLA